MILQLKFLRKGFVTLMIHRFSIWPQVSCISALIWEMMEAVCHICFICAFLIYFSHLLFRTGTNADGLLFLNGRRLIRWTSIKCPPMLTTKLFTVPQRTEEIRTQQALHRLLRGAASALPFLPWFPRNLVSELRKNYIRVGQMFSGHEDAISRVYYLCIFKSSQAGSVLISPSLYCKLSPW